MNKTKITTKRELIKYKAEFYNKLLSKYVEKLFPTIKDLKQVDGRWHFTIHKKKVELEIDEYNNANAWTLPNLTIQEIKAIHVLLIEYLEHEDSYQYRTGTSFLIDYYKEKLRYPSSKNKAFIRKMIEINHPIENDGDDGLEGWLKRYENWTG